MDVTATPQAREWTAQQKQAMAKVADWYTAADAQVFRLFGYAGVGKTSLANQIVEELGLAGRALFGAFTGKAASVLRAKGCFSADTIHSLIYQPTDKAREKLKTLRERLEAEIDPAEQEMLARAIEAEQAKLEAPEFVLKEESPLSGAPLYVVDEVSMVGEKMAADILSFGTPVLVLGDPAQLPPVEGGGYFINAAPDVLLTEIHRSALDSAVTRISIAVRTAPHGDRWLGLTGTDDDCGRVPRLRPGDLLEFDQVLCGTNRTRWRLNTVIRALRGRVSPTPQPGDRIITLANNSAAEVLNGQQWTVAECGLDVRYPDVLLEVVGEDGEGHAFDAWACGFADLKGEKLAKRQGRSIRRVPGPATARRSAGFGCRRRSPDARFPATRRCR